MKPTSLAAASTDPGVEVVDVLSAYVVHVASTRGWPVLTTDPARRLRTQPRVTLTMLAQATGVSTSTMSRLETGSDGPHWNSSSRYHTPIGCR